MKAVIIFSGYNPRAVLAFVRTLEAQKVPYGIIASSVQDNILATSYADKVIAVRKKHQLDLDEITEKIKQVDDVLGASEYLIAPSTEYLNRYLLDNVHHFNKLNCTIPLVSIGLYKEISDKATFGELCGKYDITTPREYPGIKEAVLPFVAKPRTYQTKQGNIYTPILIFNKQDLHTFNSQYDANDFYYQEFVDGSSYYLLYYFCKDGSVFKSSQMNLIQQPEGKSIVAAITSDFHTGAESGKYEKLFNGVWFRGLVMVEVKQSNGINYMIEANPRFWGPSQLFVDQNLNFFECLLYDYGVIENKPSFSDPINARYFWHGGIIESQRGGGQVVFHDYRAEQLRAEMEEWLAADIYKRTDSIEVYKQEITSV